MMDKCTITIVDELSSTEKLSLWILSTSLPVSVEFSSSSDNNCVHLSFHRNLDKRGEWRDREDEENFSIFF